MDALKDYESNTNIGGRWYETPAGHEITGKKYFHDGEDFEAFAKRVAGIFSNSGLRKAIEKSLYRADFFPAGRSLYGAGSKGKFKASMSNCYILPSPEDNIESIFEIAKKMARIFSYGGGCGVSLSKLRPKGARVYNAAKTSTGAVSFMEIFDAAGNVIGANNRRAALLIGLDCSHPDIEYFLEVKKNNTKIQSANISILFNNEFMEAVRDNKDYTLRFDVVTTGEKISKVINARDFFIKFARANHDWAEPGCLFMDRIRSHNLLSGYPADEYFIEISNPCAEYLGNAYNACNLGSVNLYNAVKNPFTGEAAIDFDYLSKAVETGIRALDEILDYGYDMQPLPENKKCIEDWRAVGLGVFGLADAFIALGLRYGSPESIALVDKLMNRIMYNALKTSNELAKEKGAFKKFNFEYIKNSPIIQMYPELLPAIEKYGLRNGSLLSVAPTGTIATMSGLSGGIEPLFRLSYERTTHALQKEQKYFKVVAKSVADLLRYNGLDIEQFTNEQIKEQFPYVAATHDIDPLERVELQAAMQKYVDNAISSTVNLKKEATADDVFNVFYTAWVKGCKGITIFRSGCQRAAILISEPEKTEVKSSAQAAEDVHFDSITPIKSRDLGDVNGSKVVKHTACVKNLYNHVYTNDTGHIVEVFTSASQGCSSNIATITRLASLCLRSGISVQEIVAEMKSSHCSACATLKAKGDTTVSNSCGTAIAEAIEAVYKTDAMALPAKRKKSQPVKSEGAKAVAAAEEDNGLLACPQCGQKTLRPEGRCFTCSNCLWTRCD